MSKKWRLNKKDLLSVGITLGLSIVAFVLTQLIDLIPMIDFGTNDQLVTFVLLGILKAGQRLLEGK